MAASELNTQTSPLLSLPNPHRVTSTHGTYVALGACKLEMTSVDRTEHSGPTETGCQSHVQFSFPVATSKTLKRSLFFSPGVHPGANSGCAPRCPSSEDLPQEGAQPPLPEQAGSAREEAASGGPGTGAGVRECREGPATAVRAACPKQPGPRAQAWGEQKH